MRKVKLLVESLLFFVIAMGIQRICFYLYSFLVYRYALASDIEETMLKTLEEKTLYYVDRTEIFYIISGWLIAMGLILFILNMTKQPLLDLTAHRLKLVNLVLCLVLGVALVLCIESLAQFMYTVIGYPYISEQVEVFDSIILTFVVIGILIPVFEEVFFRGILLNRLAHMDMPIFAVLTQAFLFSLSHFNIAQSTYLLPLGLVCGVAVYKSKSVLAGIVIHVVFNTINLYMNHFVTLDYALGQLLLMIVLGGFLIAFSLTQMRNRLLVVKEPIKLMKF